MANHRAFCIRLRIRQFVITCMRQYRTNTTPTVAGIFIFASRPKLTKSCARDTLDECAYGHNSRANKVAERFTGLWIASLPALIQNSKGCGRRFCRDTERASPPGVNVGAVPPAFDRGAFLAISRRIDGISRPVRLSGRMPIGDCFVGRLNPIIASDGPS